MVSSDALALVRFGLAAAHDPRIVNTVKVIDAQLKIQTMRGTVWHCYTRDSDGEHPDGGHFDKTGVGRGWPLLTGERAHYEFAAGRPEVAETLLRTLERFASDSGLISEQVWDTADLPAAKLWNARPTLSACPLVWADAEHLELTRSIADGRRFDLSERCYVSHVARRAKPLPSEVVDTKDSPPI